MDNEVILLRLIRLEKCLAKLQKIGSATLEVFLEKEELQERTERNIQIAAQCCIDIGNHIVAAKKLGIPNAYKDVFEQMAGANIIDKELANKMGLIAGFRNILVHDYLEVDYEIVYENLQDLDVFISSAQQVRELF